MIPKKFRERFGIQGSDEVVVREQEGKLVIETPITREELAEGYRRRAERSRELAHELDGISKEAHEGLGDPPEW